MDGSLFANAGYWCHICSQMVSPVMEVEEIKCPFCDNGFVEEMGSRVANIDAASELGSNLSLSLWAPILLGMLGGSPSRLRRMLRLVEEVEDSDQDSDSELADRRRQRSAAILQLLQDNDDDSESEGETEAERERENLINYLNRAAIIDGLNEGSNSSRSGASLGDYILRGGGLDLLIQHLMENDPNRYGTPPAKKEAVEALPTVKIENNSSCPVCLEEFAIGIEVKEMPCKHVFHSGCILPWLELHSSCPVCRFQLPADDSKRSNEPGSGGRTGSNSGDGGGGENESRSWVSMAWPLSALFSPAGSQSGEISSPHPSSSASVNDFYSDE